MKREITFKNVLITASFLSLLAFAFVNLSAHSNVTQSFSKVEISHNQVEAEETGESREIKVPNVSVLGRLWDIAQRLMDRAN